MAFISYAQNFEDIMLWRALKHVPRGFYIDVGANDPTVDSVTRAFYERGWRGVNVEPMRQYQTRLRIERPADINLAVAVGETDGELTFHDFADTGLSTLDAAIAAAHAATGKSVVRRTVPVMRLADICRDHAHGEIHFLKIDVEGFEAAVLRGMDFTQWRPWILVIEATRPQTQTRSTGEWEALVLGAGYRFAYFDGLNDYYVAQEHAELMSAFAAPPNFFDGFTLRRGHYFSYSLDELEHQLWQANVRVEAAEKSAHETHAWASKVDLAVTETSAALAAATAAAAQATQRADEATAKLAAHTSRANHTEQLYLQAVATLAATHASASWKVTRPLRMGKRALKEPLHALRRLRAIARAAAGGVLRRLRRLLARGVAQSSGMNRSAAAAIIARVPGMLARAPAESKAPADVRLAADELRRAIAVTHTETDKDRHAHRS